MLVRMLPVHGFAFFRSSRDRHRPGGRRRFSRERFPAPWTRRRAPPATDSDSAHKLPAGNGRGRRASTHPRSAGPREPTRATARPAGPGLRWVAGASKPRHRRATPPGLPTPRHPGHATRAERHDTRKAARAPSPSGLGAACRPLRLAPPRAPGPVSRRPFPAAPVRRTGRGPGP